MIIQIIQKTLYSSTRFIYTIAGTIGTFLFWFVVLIAGCGGKNINVVVCSTNPAVDSFKNTSRNTVALAFQQPKQLNNNNDSAEQQQQERSNDFLFPFISSSLRKTEDRIMRAWTCHGRNQRELVTRLAEAGIVKSPEVLKVLSLTDRQAYCNENPYMDAPQAIGLGQTISAPHMHAHVLEEIIPHLKQQLIQNPQEPLSILDVGTGSGYLTACFGRLFFNKDDHDTPSTTGTPTSSSSSVLGTTNGRVFGIDIHQHLVQLAEDQIRRDDPTLIDHGIIKLQVANGWGGLSAEAPFDAIHVGAAAASFPVLLAQQLKVGGVLIVPVGPINGAQTLQKVVRHSISSSDGIFHPTDFTMTELLGVRYVPLVQGPGQVQLN